MSTKPNIVVIGAAAWRSRVSWRRGAKVTLYEQANQFQRILAGIQMSPNAIRVLRGLEAQLRPEAFAPQVGGARLE